MRKNDFDWYEKDPYDVWFGVPARHGMMNGKKGLEVSPVDDTTNFSVSPDGWVWTFNEYDVWGIAEDVVWDYESMQSRVLTSDDDEVHNFEIVAADIKCADCSKYAAHHIKFDFDYEDLWFCETHFQEFWN